MIIDVSGVGYQVFSGEKFLNELGLGQEVEVYTHHQVREDASDLYGFKSPEDLELFAVDFVSSKWHVRIITSNFY